MCDRWLGEICVWIFNLKALRQNIKRLFGPWCKLSCHMNVIGMHNIFNVSLSYVMLECTVLKRESFPHGGRVHDSN